jgi:hypothetical protein
MPGNSRRRPPDQVTANSIHKQIQAKPDQHSFLDMLSPILGSPWPTPHCIAELKVVWRQCDTVSETTCNC